MSPWWNSQYNNGSQNNHWRQGSSNQSQGRYSGGQWWDCKDENCVSALKAAGRKPCTNRPSAYECDVCGTHWNSEKQIRDLQMTAIKKEVKAAKAKAAETPASVASGVIEVVINKTGLAEEISIDSEAEDVKPTITTVLLPDEYVALARLQYDPRELSEEWTAEASLSKFIPKKNGANKEKLREELEGLKLLVGLQKKKVAQGTTEDTEKKIAAIEKKLEASGTEEEDASLAACEYEVCRRQYAKAEGIRAARANAGVEKSTERSDRLEEICSEQIAAWEETLSTMQAQRSVRESAWLARALELENRDLETMQLAAEKIAKAKTRAGEECSQSPESGDECKLKKVEKELNDYKKKAEENALETQKATNLERADLIARLAALESKLAFQAPAARGPTLAPEVITACGLKARYTPKDMVPLARKLKGEESTTIATLLANSQTWTQCGQMPILYSHLLQGCTQPDQALQGLREMCGETIWKRLYEDQLVTLESYVPFQMATIIQACCVKIDKDTATLSESLLDRAQAKFAIIEKEDATYRAAGGGPYVPF